MLLTLAISIAAGVPLAFASGARRPPLWTAALSFPAGAAVLSCSLFLLSLSGIAWSRAALAGAVAAVIALLFLVLRVGVRGGLPGNGGQRELRGAQWSGTLVFGGFLLLLVVGYGIFSTIAAPPENDFIAIWGLKAKAFWFHRGIDWEFLQSRNNVFSHPDYPPLLPLFYDAAAVLGNGWDDRWLGLVHVAFGLSVLLAVRHLLARETGSQLFGTAAAVALSSAALSPWIGLAEGPMIAFGTIGLLLLRAGSREDDTDAAARRARAGAVFLGFAGLTKNEGLTLIVAAALALWIDGKSWRAPLRLWPAAVVAGPWLLARMVFGLSTYLAEGNALERVTGHLRHAGTLVQLIAANPPGRPLFWAGVLVALLLSIRQVVRREQFLAAAVALQLCFLTGAYLFSPYDLAWHFQWSWERLVSQVTLPLGFVAAAALGRMIVRPAEAGG